MTRHRQSHPYHPPYRTPTQHDQLERPALHEAKHDIAKSLENIHESIVEWTERTDEILPDSWRQHGDQYTTHQLNVSNAVTQIFEPGADLENNPTTLLDEPNAIMAGLLLHCATGQGTASLAENITDSHQDDKWTIQPADIADSNIVESRRNHGDRIPQWQEYRMGSAKNNTELETRHPNRQGGQRNSVRRSTRKSRRRGRTVPRPTHDLKTASAAGKTFPARSTGKAQDRHEKIQPTDPDSTTEEGKRT